VLQKGRKRPDFCRRDEQSVSRYSIECSGSYRRATTTSVGKVSRDRTRRMVRWEAVGGLAFLKQKHKKSVSISDDTADDGG